MPEIFPINLYDDTSEFRLSKEGLVIDSRVIEFDGVGRRFECSIEGVVLTVKRIDENASEGRVEWVFFRIYDPAIENVPEFTSRSYTYHGLENERAPCDVEEVTINPRVTIIRKSAFSRHGKMKRCIMGDQVERIEEMAFFYCRAMKHIRLSRSLRYIGREAFWGCGAIECLFIPPSVEEIQYQAFYWCIGMKILILPPNIAIEKLGDHVAYDCHKLLHDTVQYARGYNNDQVHHWLKHCYDHIPLLRLCADPDITAKMFHKYVQDHGTAAFGQPDDKYDLKPLHILTRCNGFASDNAIIACYNINPGAFFDPDRDGKTPLDNLLNDIKMDALVHIVKDLCINLNGRGCTLNGKQITGRKRKTM